MNETNETYITLRWRRMVFDNCLCSINRRAFQSGKLVKHHGSGSFRLRGTSNEIRQSPPTRKLWINVATKHRKPNIKLERTGAAMMILPDRSVAAPSGPACLYSINRPTIRSVGGGGGCQPIGHYLPPHRMFVFSPSQPTPKTAQEFV